MKQDLLILLTLTLLALGLRLWQLDSVPPGWRDDELIEAYVIAQNILDGDWRLYYPDASGHEGLFHFLKAGFLAAFGYSVSGIRGLSVLFGTLAVPLTYLVGKLMYNRWVGARWRRWAWPSASGG
jgi:4-amino-4-deoxy-L-arabinose transferase-like glycosyltransferase